MASIESGAEQLEDLGRALRAQSGNDLKKELLRGIRESNKPTIKKIKSSTGNYLPSSGGLAARVAKSTIGTRTRLTGTHAGITIKGTGKTGSRGLNAMNEGTVRKPLFGNKGHWFNQSIKPGFFTEPIEADAPQIRTSILRVMDDMAKKIASAV